MEFATTWAWILDNIENFPPTGCSCDLGERHRPSQKLPKPFTKFERIRIRAGCFLQGLKRVTTGLVQQVVTNRVANLLVVIKLVITAAADDRLRFLFAAHVGYSLTYRSGGA